MDRGKKACNGDRETCHKDHKSGFQRNIGNTAAQDPDLGKCKECYQQSVNTLGTRKKLKKQNLGKFVRDVYKRQVLEGLGREPFPRLQSFPVFGSRTVSYTHLDVYKRQVYAFKTRQTVQECAFYEPDKKEGKESSGKAV